MILHLKSWKYLKIRIFYIKVKNQISASSWILGSFGCTEPPHCYVKITSWSWAAGRYPWPCCLPGPCTPLKFKASRREGTDWKPEIRVSCLKELLVYLQQQGAHYLSGCPSLLGTVYLPWDGSFLCWVHTWHHRALPTELAFPPGLPFSPSSFPPRPWTTQYRFIFIF